MDKTLSDSEPKDNHSAVIDIKSSSVAEKYFCSYCNTRLTPFTEEDRIVVMSALNVLLNIGPSSGQLRNKARSIYLDQRQIHMAMS
jgi:hypothetical protein